MSLMNIQDLTLGFGSPPLLDKVSFVIEDKERICVIGRNGMGKSTLINLLNGELKPDSGKISLQKGLITAKLEQDVPENISGTVFEVIAQGLGEQGQLIANYEHLTIQVALDPTPALLQELQNVQHLVDKNHAWDLTHKIENVISRLDLPKDKEFASLSGGMKRRVMLGQAIVQNPGILFLDEPTNHLDLDSIEWLENFIKKFNGTVVFITHDRTFLQNLATRLIEIDRGKIQSYPGNYQQYLDRKQHELEVESQQSQLFDKRLAQEEVWIRQGIKARRTRNEGRVRALEDLRKQRLERRDPSGKVNMQLQTAKASGKLVIEASHIFHGYAGKTLINDFSTIIVRGDKIGIIGPNGVGKSTLLKILLGEITADKGTVNHGTKLEIAYFDQLRAQLDEDKTVAENVSYGDQFIKMNGRSIHIIGYLQDFLFPPDRANSPVKSLSGGERNRLLLARLFSQPANVLVMDEPTNDLDLETLELLEELLMNYEGTLLIVSHDRSFLNNVVTSTIVFENNGVINEYVGGYDDWIRQRNFDNKPPESQPPKPFTTSKSVVLDNKQKKEILAIERKIEKLESSLATFQHQLTNPELYTPEQKTKLWDIQDKIQKINVEIKELYQQWEDMVG